MPYDRLTNRMNELGDAIDARDLPQVIRKVQDAWGAVDYVITYVKKNKVTFKQYGYGNQLASRVREPLRELYESAWRMSGGMVPVPPPIPDTWERLETKYATIVGYLNTGFRDAAANLGNLANVSKKGFFESVGLNRDIASQVGSILSGGEDYLSTGAQKSQAQVQGGLSGVKGGVRKTRHHTRRDKRTYRHSPRKE